MDVNREYVREINEPSKSPQILAHQQWGRSLENRMNRAMNTAMQGGHKFTVHTLLTIRDDFVKEDEFTLTIPSIAKVAEQKLNELRVSYKGMSKEDKSDYGLKVFTATERIVNVLDKAINKIEEDQPFFERVKGIVNQVLTFFTPKFSILTAHEQYNQDELNFLKKTTARIKIENNNESITAGAMGENYEGAEVHIRKPSKAEKESVEGEEELWGEDYEGPKQSDAEPSRLDPKGYEKRIDR